MEKIIDKKYELIPSADDKGLYRVKALRDFGDVKKGDVGGYVQSEKNLSHYDDCWVYDNAVVFHNAKVFGKAKVYGDATVGGNAVVYDDACVYGRAVVCGESSVCGYAKVYGNARVYGDALVYGNAMVYDDAWVYGSAWVFGDAKVCRGAAVMGYAEIFGDAVVKKSGDYVVFNNFWSSGRHFTWTKSNNMWKVGCFHGSGEELIKKAYKDSKVSGKHYEAFVKLVESLKKLK